MDKLSFTYNVRIGSIDTNGGKTIGALLTFKNKVKDRTVRMQNLLQIPVAEDGSISIEDTANIIGHEISLHLKQVITEKNKV